ncbi:MAG: transposase [Gammaproteobacteria bacterium]|nr:transposase [Gammaproteobacteria bacterium]
MPHSQQTFKTKLQLALEMVHRARSLGLRYSWIGGDSMVSTRAATQPGC